MAWAEKHGSSFRVRYRLPDGSLTSETDFPTITAARDRAADIDSEQRRGTFVDPRLGQTRLHEWIDMWRDAHDVSTGTWAKYNSHPRNHILPAFGDATLADIKRVQIKAWVKTLRRRLAEPTVADIVSLLSAILGEAVDEGLSGANPCRKLRINTEGRPERHAATAGQLLQITRHCGPSDALLITTAAYTGMRWGELAGLRWRNVDLIAGIITIDPQTGALHEVHGRLELGPPKTVASVRTVHLPPFLTTLLDTHHDQHRHEHVFTGPTGALLRRANFRRRIWRPALVHAGLLGEINPIEGRGFRARWTTEDGVDREQGFRTLPAAVSRVAAQAAGGLHFHDLRHTHKTWLIEDDVPEVAQCKRMGHKPGGVRGIYSHVTQPMIDALLAGLQARWERSMVASTDLDVVTTYGAREAS